MTQEQVGRLTIDVTEPQWHRVPGPIVGTWAEEYGVMVRILCDGEPVWRRLVQAPARFAPHRRNRLGQQGAYVPQAPRPEDIAKAVEQAERVCEAYGWCVPGARVMATVRVSRGSSEQWPGTVENVTFDDGYARVRLDVPPALQGLVEESQPFAILALRPLQPA